MKLTNEILLFGLCCAVWGAVVAAFVKRLLCSYKLPPPPSPQAVSCVCFGGIVDGHTFPHLASGPPLVSFEDVDTGERVRYLRSPRTDFAGRVVFTYVGTTQPAHR